jgi:hypothetical protein
MHPEFGLLEFPLPATERRIYFEVDGQRTVQPARLHHIVSRPAEQVMTMVFAATVALQRPFIPGVHKHIPIRASLDGEMPIAYEPPVPVRERVAELRAGAERKS